MPDDGCSSQEASRSPSPSRQSLAHQDKEPLSAHHHQPAPADSCTAAGAIQFLSDSEASPKPAACPGSQQGEVVGSQHQQLKAAAEEEQDDDSQLAPITNPKNRKASRKSVTYQAEAPEHGNRKVLYSTSMQCRSESQRLRIKRKSKMLACECVALALAELGEEVSRAIQCISILKVCADYGTDLPRPLYTLLQNLVCTCAPPEWRLDSMRHIPQPGAASTSHSLFWRPYMWTSQLDMWLKGVKQHLKVLETMTATATSSPNLKSPEPGSTGWDLSAIRNPQSLVATVQRLFCQSQSVPLQNTTCTATLTTVSAHEVDSLGSKNSVLFSVLPTGEPLPPCDSWPGCSQRRGKNYT